MSNIASTGKATTATTAIASAKSVLYQRKSTMKQVFDLSEAGISLLDHNSQMEFQEPFLYSMFKWIEKVPTDRIPTAAVGFYAPRNAYVFLYNPWFMAKLGWTSKDDPTLCHQGRMRQKSVILHELFHIHGRHLNERNLKEIFESGLKHEEYIRQAANHAMDLSINSTLNLDKYLSCGLFPGGITSPTEEDLRKNPYAGLPRSKSAEYYATAITQSPELLERFQKIDRAKTRAVETIEEIMKSRKASPEGQGENQGDKDQNQGQGNKSGDQGDNQSGENEPQGQQEPQDSQDQQSPKGQYEGFDKVPDVFDDSHLQENSDGSGSGDGNGDRFTEENIYNSMIRKALGDMKQRGWGSMPSHMQEAILDRVKIKPVNWKQKLRELTGRTERMYRTTSFRKLNRKYPWIHPGHKVSHTSKILVAVDESGSVRDETLAKFFEALDQLSGSVGFYLVPFTASIDPKDIVKIGRFTKIKMNREKTGGTDFDVVTEFANQSREFEALIIATDMECYKPRPCRIPRWWVTDESGEEWDRKHHVSSGEPMIVIRD
jgi:predicted metal-dependent peptidase